MRALLDINMLLALSEPRHPAHGRATAWRRHHLGDHGWASCPLTQNGFVRISTQKSYAHPKSIAESLAVMRRLVARPDHQFWPDDVSILDPTAIDYSRLLTPAQITDVYLLALAVKHGGRFVTLDTGISRLAVRGADDQHLLVV